MNEGDAIKIVYQGVPGSYTEMALVEFNNLYGLNLYPVEERGFFEGVYEKVSGDIGLAFVPFVNSQAGTVYQNIDLFMKHDIEILAEHYFAVDHCFAVKKEHADADIKEVHSHYQALDQCTHFIREQDLQPVTFHDTAAAAEMVSQSDEAIGCICSERAATLYGLHIKERKIQNIKNNVTRFLLIRRRGDRFAQEHAIRDSERRKTSVLFQTKDIPAALYQAIGGFAEQGVNITKLESRPDRKQNFSYIFYMEFDGGVGKEPVDTALKVLEEHSGYLNILGSYSKKEIAR